MTGKKAAPADLLIMGRHLGNRWGGVYEVLRGLVGALDSLDEAQGRRIELLLPREGIRVPELTHVKTVVLSQWGGSRLLWDHWTVPAYAKSRRRAVLYNPGIVLPVGLSVPGVVSIHDLAYFPPAELDGREEYLRGDAWYMRRMIQRSLKHAAAVHVPSESTRSEILRVFPAVNRERIRVWPYGVDAGWWGSDRENVSSGGASLPGGVSAPYLIYPGGLSRRKNVGVLLDAFRMYRARHPDFRLVLTGGSKRTLVEEGLESRIREGEAEGAIVRVGETSADDLRALFHGAWALVYPSLYEGFGLPPLEAQAAGCPVICSNSTSLPEVVGDAALMFDARSPEALLAAMERLEDASVREHLVQRGKANSAEMGWNRIALSLIELADELARAPE